ncbi:histone acetyltransferase [Lobulomyces angularis]|nr:histone acetyltransferase [Lobulomyces angularis]
MNPLDLSIVKTEQVKREREEDSTLTKDQNVEIENNLIPTSKRFKKLALEEERDGTIEFQAISNDGTRQNLITLTGLKNIICKQLPAMPKEYISRLVYDRNHYSLALVKKEPFKVLGGICYRPFVNRKFAEIVFLAIDSSEQEKGYGSRLMSHTKDYVRFAHDVHYFLTCADNNAVGYFKKQGFTAEITLDKSVWVGYIKDYEGSTLMQCSMLPRVEYLEAYELIVAQRTAVFKKISQISKSHIIHNGLDCFKQGKTIQPEDIPGVKGAGYTKELSKMVAMSQRKKSPLYRVLKRILDEAREHKSSWPFLEPVSGVPSYYELITHPMDLGTMTKKVENDEYKSVESFQSDLQLIFDNCKKFNAPGTKYNKAALGLEKFCKDKISKLCANL